MNFDSKQLRQVLGAFPTGVTVVTTIDAAGQAYGVTANSFSSVSLDPPLVLWSQSNQSSSHAAFSGSERFVINIMADDQVQVANQFAKSGIDKFKDIATCAGLGGVPVIDGTAANLECLKVAAYPGGDHTIFIGLIERFQHVGHRPRFYGRRMTLAPARAPARAPALALAASCRSRAPRARGRAGRRRRHRGRCRG